MKGSCWLHETIEYRTSITHFNALDQSCTNQLLTYSCEKDTFIRRLAHNEHMCDGNKHCKWNYYIYILTVSTFVLLDYEDQRKLPSYDRKSEQKELFLKNDHDKSKRYASFRSSTSFSSVYAIWTKPISFVKEKRIFYPCERVFLKTSLLKSLRFFFFIKFIY